MGLDICSGMRKVLNDSVSSKMSTRLRSPLFPVMKWISVLSVF